MPNRFQQGFIHLVVLVVALLGLGLVVSANVDVTKEFPSSFKSENILGEGEYPEKVITKTETKIEKKIENEKTETKIETTDGQKIRTKIEDNGSTKIEIKHKNLKLKYIVEDGKVKLKIEDKSGKETKLEKDEIDEIEDEIENELENEGIKIATNSVKPIFSSNDIAAQTDFPLSIDVETKKLMVTTPAGEKTVTILPDEAVQNLLSTKFINKVEQTTNPDLIDQFGVLNGITKLEIRKDKVVYRVKGIKVRKLFGFIPLDTSKTIFISVDTGNIVAQEESILTKIIETLSP